MTSYEERMRSCPRCPHHIDDHIEGRGCAAYRCPCRVNPPRPRCSACGSYIRLDGRCANADCHRWSPEV